MQPFLQRAFRLASAQLSHPFRLRLSQLRRCRSVSSVELFLDVHRSLIAESDLRVSVDLGCSTAPRNPFKANVCYGLDISGGTDFVICCDLFNESLPFADGEIACVTAFDFIEHIPRVVVGNGQTRFPFVEIMNEVYRVLSPGGFFLSYTPAFPFKEAFQDPTHVNIITEDTFPFYFSSDRYSGSPGYGFLYGFNNYFEVIDQAWHGFRLVTLLKKP